MPLAFRQILCAVGSNSGKRPSGAARALLRLIEQRPELLESLAETSESEIVTE